MTLGALLKPKATPINEPTYTDSVRRYFSIYQPASPPTVTSVASLLAVSSGDLADAR